MIARDVGGGFGSKIPFYPGDALTIFASQVTGQPVKWIEDRSENYLATIHGRDQITDVELTAKRDGTITGLRIKALSNMGAYSDRCAGRANLALRADRARLLHLPELCL